MLAFALAVALAAVHVLAWRVRGLDAVPRSRGLSLAGGISVAYVFAHLLPELAHSREALGSVGPDAEGTAWLLALGGLVVFYGLERAAETSRDDADPDRTEREVFWLHVGCYAIYNVLIGYLLTAEMGGHSPEKLAAYSVAMGLHFLVNDVGLRSHHKGRYDAVGRHLLAAAVVGGASLGAATELPGRAVAGLVAFLAGSVVLNVLKEELPDERESRFWPFAVGAVGYAALLTAI